MTDELYFMAAVIKPWDTLNNTLGVEIPEPDMNELQPLLEALLTALNEQPERWAKQLGLAPEACRDKAREESRACAIVYSWDALVWSEVSVSRCVSPMHPIRFWRYVLEYQGHDMLIVTRDAIEYWLLRASIQVAGRPELIRAS
jgi:hypothetical protein